ncbi:hypothetical protein FQN60_003388 [Etheostoma spectabile]|uniref:Uncharacterized protein n=1 Tax=Etheostoma spectabile TaxID=54343 RepID=A0A5J5CJG4_9PERO|nr:hypothetical protein FQN60_003388 [Etheostoma spectabile]
MFVETDNHSFHLGVQRHVGPVGLFPEDVVGSHPGLLEPHRLKLLSHCVASYQVHFALELAHSLQHVYYLRGARDGLVPPPDDPVAVKENAVHRVQHLFSQRCAQPCTF